MRLCGPCVRSRPDRHLWRRVLMALLMIDARCDGCGGRLDRIGTVH